MVRLKEAVLVEGRYDKNTLSQIVDAPIFEAGGFGIFHNGDMISLLRLAAGARGLIIFTDSDGAGFVIRNRLKSLLPKEGVLHAYIPDVAGKEKRKVSPSREGLLGVEGMSPEIILEALRRCGAHFLDEAEAAPGCGDITRRDLFQLGLMGGDGSAARRDFVKERLSLPKHLGTTALLDALNLITDREGLEELLRKVQRL